jgi:non-haem Fe2+, alpha-ketoglutarate-dependent halogenase
MLAADHWKNMNYGALDQIERDLSFQPSTVDTPKRLTSDQISEYNERGSLTGIRVFDTAVSDEYRSYFDGLLEQAFKEGRDSYSIGTAHRKHRGVYEMATDPMVLDYVEDILGGNFVLWGTHFFCKMPGDGKTVSWHQDASYWPMTPSRTVTLWLAIDDSDTENACMRVIPGSHKHGHLSWRPSESAEDNVLDQTVEQPEQFGEAPEDLILRAGEMSLHSDLLLHGSDRNESERRRCGLTMRYAASSVRAYMGWHEKGVVCRGDDPDGNWANYPPPENA